MFISPVSVSRHRRFARLADRNGHRAFIPPVFPAETGVLNAEEGASEVNRSFEAPLTALPRKPTDAEL